MLDSSTALWNKAFVAVNIPRDGNLPRAYLGDLHVAGLFDSSRAIGDTGDQELVIGSAR